MSPGLVELGRLAALLTRVSRGRLSNSEQRQIAEERDLSSRCRMAMDRYRPRGPARVRLLALHGLTLNGKDDERLVHFARSLAVAGVDCVVPRLPALAELEMRPSDIDQLAALVHELSGEAPLGLVGFSFGASYALLAAGRPAIADRVAFCLCFGACHSFLALVEELRAAEAAGADPAASDESLYLQMVLAYRHRRELGLSDGLTAELADWLRHYCSSDDIDGKREFFRKHLRPLDLIRFDEERQDRKVLEALSPAGKLAALRTRVALVHDPADPVVSADHARRLAAELTAEGREVQLLISPLFSHVKLASALRLGDWLRLARVLAPLVQSLPE